MTAVNPLDWHGGAFLAFYITLFILSFVLSFAIAGWLRPEGPFASATDEDELAVLSGGVTRLGETALARLYARGGLAIRSDGIHLHADRAGSSGAERDLLALPSPFRWKAAREVLSREAAWIEERLADRGLMTRLGEARQLGLFAALPFALLLGLGVARLAVDTNGGTDLLLAAMGATVLAGTYRLVATDRRTRAGIAVVSDAKRRYERLSRAPTEAETGMAVALFGTAVLVGSPMADLHEVRREKGDGGGSGCGGGDGHSGCGGGGCGGCGG